MFVLAVSCLISLMNQVTNHVTVYHVTLLIALLYKSSAVAEMGDCLATIGMGRKWGGAAVGGWVPMAWSEAYLFTKWHLDPSNRLATIVRMPRSSSEEYPYRLFLSLA